jgi:hypothetical protein
MLEALSQTMITETSRIIFNSSTTYESYAQVMRSVEITILVANIMQPNDNPSARSNNIITIGDINPLMLLDFAEAIQQSNRDINVTELQWTIFVLQSSHNRGAGMIKPPCWVLDKEKETFKIQQYNSQVINCGAFCIAYLTKARNESIEETRRRAFNIQTECNIGKYETPLKIGTTFKNLFPNHRLAILHSNLYTTKDVYEGVNWTPVKYSTRESVTKLRNSFYMVYLPLEQHFGITNCPARFFKQQKDSNGFFFCHLCVTKTKCICTNVKQKNRKEVYKQCKYCNKVTCKEKCIGTCNECKTKYQKDYQRFHRCIVMHDKKKKLFLKCGEEPHEQKYRLYAYDIESRMKIIESETCIKFETEDHEFTSTIPVYNYQPVNQHIVNLVVFRDVFDPSSETVLEGDDCLTRFIQIMTSSNNGRNICVAHNASGYDARLIMEEILQNFMEKTPSFTKKGTKFMEIKYHNTIFRDSLLFLPGSLSNLAKSFNLTTRKGYFPHLFNTEENYDYEGQLPSQKYFDLTFMAKSEREVDTFKTWHDRRSTEGKKNFLLQGHGILEMN